MGRYRAPLQIHVVHSKGFPEGPAWARRLQQWFTGKSDLYAVPEPNLPVLVWSDASGMPPAIGWPEADRTALIVLVDDSLAGSPDWRGWLGTQWASRRPGDMLLACTVTPNFANAGAALREPNAIRLDRITAEERLENLVLQATHALTRWFSSDGGRSTPVRLFISHAKAKRGSISGRDLAEGLKDFIQHKPLGSTFFDEVDIGGGELFEQTLGDAVDISTIIVLLTDAFSGRFWCGWEVVTAKSKRRPMIVVDALEEGEVTSLGYGGKTPTIRWNATATLAPADEDATAKAKRVKETEWVHRRIVAAALLEGLRQAHNARQLEAIRLSSFSADENVLVVARPPELAILPAREKESTIVLHADPPLPRYEIALVQRHRPDVRLVSAAQALAGSHTGTPALHGARVAVSISDSPDREARGLNRAAQDLLWTRLASHLLVTGAQLAYGGDLRVGGYTAQLFDLARSAADAGEPLPDGIVHWYLGWPLSAGMTDAERAATPSAFVLHLGPLPADAEPGTDPSWKADFIPEHHFAWTLGMRDMRRAMANECSARILVGGQLRAVSPWPGLLEEFETSLGKPIYLVGGFGGAACAIIEALQGGRPPALTEGFQDEGGKRQPLRTYYEARRGPVDWSARLEKLHALGVAGLNNGLSAEENERLFVTRDPTEVVALILRGLRSKLRTAAAS